MSMPHISLKPLSSESDDSFRHLKGKVCAISGDHRESVEAINLSCQNTYIREGKTLNLCSDIVLSKEKYVKNKKNDSQE